MGAIILGTKVRIKFYEWCVWWLRSNAKLNYMEKMNLVSTTFFENNEDLMEKMKRLREVVHEEHKLRNPM